MENDDRSSFFIISSLKVVKHKIFQVMHLILNFESMSLKFFYVLCLVELMQLLAFPFSSKVNSII